MKLGWNSTGMARRFATAMVCFLGLGVVLLGVDCLGATSEVVLAQSRGPVQRTLEGKVERKDGSPLKGAVVYLQDGRSQAVRSALVAEDGSYRFVQLAQNTDYTVWAQLGAKKSKTRGISSFDSKNDFNFTLVIEP
jgi:hypothetical protein